MNITSGEEDQPMPTTDRSEKKIREAAPDALRYLQKTNNIDLAEMLGLEPKGEN